MNLALKMALISSKLPAYRVAADCGISESRLSRIATGRLEPTPEELERLARVLGVPASQLMGKTRTCDEIRNATSPLALAVPDALFSSVEQLRRVADKLGTCPNQLLLAVRTAEEWQCLKTLLRAPGTGEAEES